jgi:hypothetical protein
MSEKIKSHHLERKAIVYVRQSSAYQVQNNRESQKLQYAMQERLRGKCYTTVAGSETSRRCSFSPGGTIQMVLPKMK